MRRRDFLVGGAGCAAWALTGGWKRWALDHGTVAALALRTRALGDRLHREAAGRLLPEIRSHLAGVLALARAGGVGVPRRLHRVGAETAVLAGWTAWLVGRRAEAERWYAEAGVIAHEAGDAEARALLLTARAALHSGVPSGGQAGDPARALAELEAAHAAASEQASPYLHAWIAASQAQEHALLGRGPAMRRCLERAASVLPGRPGPGFFSDWDDRLLRAYAGVSYVLAGEPREAIAVLDPLLARVEVTATQWAVASEADLAAAYAAAGEQDHAGEILARALEHAEGLQLAVDAERAAGYRRRLLPSGRQAPPAVRLLDERLRQRGLG
jgi:tetratricopeptide (TPR) repeat protein